MALLIRERQMGMLRRARQPLVFAHMLAYGQSLFPGHPRMVKLAHASLRQALAHGYSDRARDLYFALSLAWGRDVATQGPPWMAAMLRDERTADPSARVMRLHAEVTLRVWRQAASQAARAAFHQGHRHD